MLVSGKTCCCNAASTGHVCELDHANVFFMMGLRKIADVLRNILSGRCSEFFPKDIGFNVAGGVAFVVPAQLDDMHADFAPDTYSSMPEPAAPLPHTMANLVNAPPLSPHHHNHHVRGDHLPHMCSARDFTPIGATHTMRAVHTRRHLVCACVRTPNVSQLLANIAGYLAACKGRRPGSSHSAADPVFRKHCIHAERVFLRPDGS